MFKKNSNGLTYRILNGIKFVNPVNLSISFNVYYLATLYFEFTHGSCEVYISGVFWKVKKSNVISYNW